MLTFTKLEKFSKRDISFFVNYIIKYTKKITFFVFKNLKTNEILRVCLRTTLLHFTFIILHFTF